MMRRTQLNFWLDLLSLLVMLGLAATGGIIHFVLPAGTGHFYRLFGLGRHDYGEVHFYLAVTTAALLAVHVLLHWSWICGVAGRAFGSKGSSRRVQTAWGLSLLCGIVLFLGGGLWWASGRVERNAVEPRDRASRDHAPVQPGIDASPGGADGAREVTVRGTSSAQDEAILPPRLVPEEERVDHEKHQEDCPAGAAINGRTTLSEAASTCGLSVEQMKLQLKLPAGVNSSEKLGRLKRQYVVDIHDVRRLACR